MNLKLKSRIIERFGSQANFAQAVGADEPTVSRVVNGRKILNPEKLKQWAAKLGCDRKVFDTLEA